MKNVILVDESYKLALDVVDLYQNMRASNERVISRQLLKSGTSIGANIKESGYAETNEEVVRKLKHALKECNETMYWLELIRDSKIYDKDTTDIHNECRNVLRLLSRAIASYPKKVKK